MSTFLPDKEPARSKVIDKELMSIPINVAQKRSYGPVEVQFILCDAIFQWHCSYGHDESKTLADHKRLLTTISKNVCNAHHHQGKLTIGISESIEDYLKEKETDDLCLVIAAVIDEQRDDIIRKAFNQEVDECLSKIDRRASDVFRMVALHGWSHKEAADEVGIESNYSQQLLYKARLALKPVAEKFHSLLIG